jgi:hypothetical protein
MGRKQPNCCVSLVRQHTEKFGLQNILIFILKVAPESLLYQLFIPILNAFLNEIWDPDL